MYTTLHSYFMFQIFGFIFYPFSALEKSSHTQDERVWRGRSFGPDVTGGANPAELKLWHVEDPKLGLLKSSRPEIPRALPDCLPEVSAGSLRSQHLAAGWRQGGRSRTCQPTQLSFGQKHHRRHQAHQQKNTWIHTLLSSLKIPGSQIQLVMRGVGGRGCFVATVLLTVCVNLLHYPLNPHLPSEQKFTTSVFSINLATGSQLLICKCSPRFLDAIVRLDELVGHW